MKLWAAEAPVLHLYVIEHSPSSEPSSDCRSIVYCGRARRRTQCGCRRRQLHRVSSSAVHWRPGCSGERNQYGRPLDRTHIQRRRLPAAFASAKATTVFSDQRFGYLRSCGGPAFVAHSPPHFHTDSALAHVVSNSPVHLRTKAR